MTSPENPFGTRVTAEEIIDTLSFFDDWEDRYKYIIDLGKELPELPEALRTEERKIRGCQSQVWIDTDIKGGRLQLNADSDAFIVKGLLGVVLAAYNNKTPSEILDFDIDAYFESLDLLGHLSPTRGNGLRAMVARIREIAAAA
ncbi:SufE protein probably involved in Fe-S center assembly [Luminiphilus syltensis NOR5-1B]|uniref:SufE protein probably involved in Fe-S center assembly n=1 Tax=Luminiphilus syltensis NOR5-1B TaxID=565045 RepID=B8KQU7_9GAMM|nr:SufE family protein [Luminiphilus syltensis]EED34248.1 SufE protein probably involved in Fe-S center assembly [Luminiphilus syltensis NOR5-1B]